MKVWTLILALALFSAAALAAADDSAPALLAAGRADDAITTLHSKINASPNDAESYNLLCRVYFSMGDWDHGISACEKAVALDPGNSRYHMWLGRIYGEKADSANFISAASLAGKVRNEFEAAVRLDPNNVEARSDLGEFYLEAPGIVGGGRDKAEAQAQALAGLDASKADYLKGRIAEKKKDFAAAEREYRAAIEASHGSALTWFNLALFFRHQQRWEDMEDAIRHAVSTASGSSGNHHGVGRSVAAQWAQFSRRCPISAPLSGVEFQSRRSAGIQGPLPAGYRPGEARGQAGRGPGISRRPVSGQEFLARPGSAGPAEPLSGRLFRAHLQFHFLPRRIYFEGEEMNSAPGCVPRICAVLVIVVLPCPAWPPSLCH